MPGFLNNFPRVGFIAVVPVVVFLIAAAASFGMGGGDNNTASSQPTVTATLPVSAAAATPTRAALTPTAVATPTAQPNRADCSAIRGTDYRSEAEKDWFNQNCTGTASASTGSTGSTGSSGSSGSSGSNSVPSGGSGGTGTGPAIAAGGEYALGDRLIIPGAGVNAPVSGVKVGSNGVMPDPVGYFNAVWYDFSALGLGGYVNGGNLVLAGHVDCGRCVNGGPGTAIFYNTRYLGVGDTIQYVSGGVTYNYVVFSNVDYSANSDFAAVVSPGAADLTLITCTGSFSGGHYDLRNVVFARRV